VNRPGVVNRLAPDVGHGCVGVVHNFAEEVDACGGVRDRRRRARATTPAPTAVHPPAPEALRRLDAQRLEIIGRLRAYSKLLTVYEDVQRAVTYLRGNRYDADSIVPNLHPGRRGPRRKQDEVTEVPPGAVVSPTGSGAPAASSSAASGTVPVATPAAAPSAGPSGPFMPAAVSRS
jgi:hypothetical protein